jgi:phosphate-selective porin OprO/OprP
VAPARARLQKPASVQPERPGDSPNFGIQSAEGTYQLKLGGFVQADGRFFTRSEGLPNNTFVVRRARLELRGTIAKYFELRVQPALVEDRVTVLDAFGNVHLIEEVQLRVGKMKSPVGLEYLQSATDLLFPELGLPSLLVPQRDVGALVHGKLLDGTVLYQLGAFNGVADGTSADIDENASKDFTARLFLHPFKALRLPALEGFGIGVAGTVGNQRGALPRFRTPGREAFFAYAEGARADGRRQRMSPQAYWYFGPIGAFVEYIRCKQRVTDGTASADVTSQAVQVAGSVVIGGKPSYRGATIALPLDPLAGTWGAVELAARYGWLGVSGEAFDQAFADDETSARGVQSFGVSASYWFVKGTRAAVSYDHTRFQNGAAVRNRETEGVAIARLQVSL